MADRIKAIFGVDELASVLWAIFVLGIISLGVVLNQPILTGVPFAILFVGVVVRYYPSLYLLFFLIIPFSVEVYLPNGLGTSLPSEPIMWMLTGLGLVLFISRGGQTIDISKYMTPITGLVVLHLAWIGMSSLWSTDTIRSVKFLLAKIWYVVPFYFLAIHFLSDQDRLKKCLQILIWSLLVSLVYVFMRHAAEGFSFKSSNDVVQPFYRNHVDYASMIVLLLPFVIGLGMVTGRKWIYGLVALFFVICIYFSFTRAAILGIGIGVGAYFIIQFKWVIKVLLIASISVIVGLGYLLRNNNYLELAPDFEKTITHTKFDNLIEATYKMEDISTMERLYRWVAGFEMLSDKPIQGFGPSTFYVNYNKYTISAFQTYVSNNPDKSGVHNYYLMTAVDQGIIGFLIFISMVFVVLIYGEKAYHALTSKTDKIYLMSFMVSFIIILCLNLINDLLESDKVGPFFFIAMAIVSIYYHRSRNQEHQH